MTLKDAADEALGTMSKKLAKAKNNFSAGIIGIGKDGIPVFSFRTEQMAWAWAKDGKLHNGVNPRDNVAYSIKVEGNKTTLTKVVKKFISVKFKIVIQYYFYLFTFAVSNTRFKHEILKLTLPRQS
jgi:hypothetical protein